MFPRENLVDMLVTDMRGEFPDLLCRLMLDPDHLGKGLVLQMFSDSTAAPFFVGVAAAVSSFIKYFMNVYFRLHFLINELAEV